MGQGLSTPRLIENIRGQQAIQPWLWLLLGVVFLTSRLYHLTVLPIFLDESLHILWALDIARSGNWFATDGARLLPIWILYLILPVATDILWSGRLLAALIGLGAAWGCFLVGQSLFNRRVGLGAFLLYLLNPFTLHNDRLLVMTDVLLVLWVTLTVWLSFKLVSAQSRWLWSGGLGMILGIIILTNLRGILIWALPVMIGILFGRRYWFGYAKVLILAYLIALLVSAPVWWILQTGLQASQGVSLVGNSASTWLAYWGQNIGLLGSWLWAYFTPGLSLALIIAVFVVLGQQFRAGLLLAGWGLLFMIPWILTAESWYPRYTLPAFPALLILLAYFFDQAWAWANRRLSAQPWLASGLTALVALLLLWPSLVFDYWQWHHPAKAPYPAADRFQYVEGWPSGYGVAEVVKALQTQVTRRGPVFVAMDRDVTKLMGQLAFESWREPEPAIHVLDVQDQTLTAAHIYQQVTASPLPVYWVSDDNSPDQLAGQAALALVHIEPIASFARPGGKSHLYVYYLSVE